MSSVMDLDADVVELAPWTPAEPARRLAELAFRADAWLPAEDTELRRCFAADMPITVIADAVGRTFQATRHRVFVLGLRRNSTLPWSELEDAELARRYGFEAAATIARDLGRGVAAVYCRARLHRLSDEAAPAYDDWEDQQIRAGYARGVPVGQIATLIGRPLLGVSTRAHYLGLRHVNAPEGWEPAEVQRALELAETGAVYKEIIAQLATEGFPQRTVRGFGLKVRAIGYGRGWGRPWLSDEDELLRRAYANNESLTPLRMRLGRGACSIRWRAGELGLQGTHARRDGWRGRTWSAEDEALLRAEFGKTPSKQLAAKLGRTPAAMFSRANALRLQHGYIRMFSPDDRRAIGIVWRLGLPLSVLARAMDRDPAVISKHAIRIGIPFDSANRPVKPDRGKGHGRDKQLSLEQILQLLPPDEAFDGRLERAYAEVEERARTNRSRGASDRARRYRDSIGMAA